MFLVVNCGDPGLYHFSERSGVDFDYNMNVTYSCGTGFFTSDESVQSTIRCQADGEWSQINLCQGWAGFSFSFSNFLPCDNFFITEL